MSNTLFVPPSPRVAFVTGANGITGHAIIEHLIRTPQHEWSQIIITSRRPPSTYWVDPRVKFIALDFLEPTEAIVSNIQDACKDVTHAFFTSYVHDSELSKLPEKNCPLFRNFLEAIDSACPNLQRVVLQTGGKHYGIQFQGLSTPCYESLPRYDGPGKETLFYYEQEDSLFAIQKRRKTWHYNIIRPFGIFGFTPQFLGMNEALPIAQYFLICRELGQSPKWPGSFNGYHQVEGQCYAPSIADMHVWAATRDNCRDQAFNHGNGDAVVWRFLWSLFGDYFGNPMDPSEAPTENGPRQLSLAEWAQDKRPVWRTIVARCGGNVDSFQEHGFAMLDWLFSPSTPGAAFMTSVQKARKFGWTRIDDSYEAWISTFRSYENADILPSRDRL
ncbi:SDR family oxidoreductase [Aspergillus melleus]|uniref:SDR family oxidoreductase n=1 Tax=Aspergillus melleus TaxID=138277 RepID=UPI001E8D5640|nr:uncharacterized protein LDX57_004054 [Aspergillus melleus]KAH8426308.1 hypothetical protein LDX57_004054 [Aspergillus melleus]